MEALKNKIKFNYRKFRKRQLSYGEWSYYLDKIKAKYKEEAYNALTEVFTDNRTALERLRKYTTSFGYVNKIRKYCNLHSGSDIEPNEVLKVVDENRVIIRKMDAVLKHVPSHTIGGFAAHYENNEQRWICVSNPENETKLLILRKKGWGGGKYQMSDKPFKFYDYNF